MSVNHEIVRKLRKGNNSDKISFKLHENCRCNAMLSDPSSRLIELNTKLIESLMSGRVLNDKFFIDKRSEQLGTVEGKNRLNAAVFDTLMEN